MTTQKKSFKDENPALQFIDIGDDKTDKTSNTVNMYNASNESNTLHTTVLKKKGRPPSDRERKTKRLNLLIQPSLIDSLNKVAYMKRSSVNDLINTLIKDYVEKEADAVTQYDNLFPE